MRRSIKISDDDENRYMLTSARHVLRIASLLVSRGAIRTRHGLKKSQLPKQDLCVESVVHRQEEDDISTNRSEKCSLAV